MPTATLDGIETYYETCGSGTPILMCAPGGFDATIDKWRVASAWTGIDPIQALSAEHRVILYDRRECGPSGGRVERLSWASFTKHGKALLDHLNIDAAWLRGGWRLRWPVGGYRWKGSGEARFMRHYECGKRGGLKGVVGRAASGKSFWVEREAGAWGGMIGGDGGLAERFLAEDVERYLGMIM